MNVNKLKIVISWRCFFITSYILTTNACCVPTLWIFYKLSYFRKLERRQTHLLFIRDLCEVLLCTANAIYITVPGATILVFTGNSRQSWSHFLTRPFSFHRPTGYTRNLSRTRGKLFTRCSATLSLSLSLLSRAHALTFQRSAWLTARNFWNWTKQTRERRVIDWEKNSPKLHCKWGKQCVVLWNFRNGLQSTESVGLFFTGRNFWIIISTEKLGVRCFSDS